MRKIFGALLAAGLVLGAAAAQAQTASHPSGRWQGKIHIPDRELGLTVHLAKGLQGGWMGSITVVGSTAVDVPLGGITVVGTAVRFTASLPRPTSFEGRVSVGTDILSGTVSNHEGEAPFELTRMGDANVQIPPRSTPLSKEFEGAWEGTLKNIDGKTRLVRLKLYPAVDGLAAGTVIDQGNLEIPATTVTIAGRELQLEARSVSGIYHGTLDAKGEIAGEWRQGPNHFPLTFARSAAESPVERWARAVGGRDSVSAVKSIYREASIQVGDFQGMIKVWHTADGKYRKEEQIASYSRIETFDGVDGLVQQGPHLRAK